MEIIPPETQIAENIDIDNPTQLFIWVGLVIKIMPINPNIIKKKVLRLKFSEKIRAEKIHVKKTFEKPIVLAWANERYINDL